MPSSRENARLWLLLFIFFLTLFSRSDGPSSILSSTFGNDPGLVQLREAHGILNSTTWGAFVPNEVKEHSPPWDSPRFLNLTGFRSTDGFAWKDLTYFKNRCTQWSNHVYPPDSSGISWNHGPEKKTWQNATGTVHGKWVRRKGSVPRTAASYNLTAIAPGVDWAFEEEHDITDGWAWNVTGNHGTILLRLHEDDSDVVYTEPLEDGEQLHSASVAREISAVANIQDEETATASSFALRLYGVHWPRQGSILLTTTSEKFAGIFGLPHLSPDPEFFHSSQMLLNRTIDAVLRRRERSRFSGSSNPWTAVVEEDGLDDVPIPRCEYIMYLQLHPIHYNVLGDDNPNHSPLEIDKLERELRFPTGAPRWGVPELRMSMVAWSPDCSYYLESKGPPLFPSVEGEHLVGVKSEILLARIKLWMFGFAAILMGQLWLLQGQMKESNTPSTLGRINFYTVATMLMADGLVFVCSSAWSLSATNTFLPSLMLTFAAFMSMTIGAGFLSEIYKNQEPERRREQQQQQQQQQRTNNAQPTAVNQSSSSGRLPAPVTAGPVRPLSPPIIIPSDQDIDAEIAANSSPGASTLPTGATTTGPSRPRLSSFASITGTFVFSGILILIITASSLSWPPRARAIYLNIISFTYLSMWVPQIRRNILRNSRRAFAWRFVIGQSVLRLLPFAYFYLVRDNILFVEPDITVFGLLCAWVWIQIFVLGVQDVLGPRAGIPANWLPPVWEYHPVLREDNLEAGGLPIGLVASSSGSTSGDSAPPSPSADRKRSWSLGADETPEDGARRREREKEFQRHGMVLRYIDCAICTEVLEVPVVVRPGAATRSDGLAGVFARRAYMVTPCRHIFHTKCLEGWFRYKLQCPICREELPPL